MNYKEIPNFECPNDQCWLRDGECCKLDMALFEEMESNETLSNLRCTNSYFGINKIRRQLEAEALELPKITKDFTDYKEYKEKLDTELRRTTEGFVRIGYLLKVAKDTDVLKESGYANVYEFAQAEYNIDKSQVSRFISINDRFSEGGYSDRLKEEFKGFGHAKLTIMLQLPDEINTELSPEFTKSEIQALREEYDAEQSVTDLEVLMEGEDREQKVMDNNLYKVLHQLGKDEPELYVKLFTAVDNGPAAVQETMAPDGERIYNVRIMGVGRLMLSVKSIDRPLTITNMRSGEKEEYSWDNLVDILKSTMAFTETAEESWETVYGEKFPKKEEVAPVQQISATPAPKKEPPKKETKVKKAAPPKKKEPEKPVEEEEQIPGQDNVMNHPEYLPEEMQKTAEILNEEDISEENPAAVLENVTEQAEIVDEIPLEIETAKLTEEELEDIWSDMELNSAKLNLFVQDYKGNINSVTKERLKTAYQNAIALASDIERILNNV